MSYVIENYENETPENQILIMQQMFMEQKFLEEATKKYENSISRMLAAGLFANTTEGSILQKMSVEAVAEQLRNYFNANIRGNGALYKNYLKDNFSGREEILAFTVLEFLLNAVSVRSPKVPALTVALTSKILDLLSVEQFKKNEPKFYSYLEYEYKSRGIGYVNSRKKKLSSMTGNTVSPAQEGKEATFKANIGARLIDCVISSGCNLFETRIRYVNGKTEKVLTLTEDSLKIIGKVRDRNVLFSVTYKPLIAKPIPWNSLWDDGGYYCQNNLTFIRNQKSCRYIDNNIELPQLQRMFNVINHIQETRWKINTYILDVVNQIIDNSMVDPNSPASNPKFYAGLPYMDTLNVYEMVPKEAYGELDERGVHKLREDYKKWYRDKEIQLKKLEANRSKRIMFTLAHNIATEYRDREALYFTYNTDFRGRLYPIQQILTPQSTGAVKAFLTFADEKILDDKSYHWLKIHTANTYGLDKESFRSRGVWVDANIKMIVACANDPINNIEWWNQADEPLMFLAACRAIANHLEGKPVGLPINLDATCSGLQLYSGLLRDKEGAIAVNVIDKTEHGYQEAPADVYTDVAKKVISYLDTKQFPTRFTFTTRDGENKTVNTFIEAEDLKGNVTRSLTKRNVMTVPYSVTKRGMFEQIRELLDEMEDDEQAFWKGDKWVVAKLLVELNSKAIADIVSGATVGQEFVKKITKEFYDTENEKPLIWETPIFKFPVVQWKTKSKKKKVLSVFGFITLQTPTNKINKQQQSNGIAPNLIHSLDATLMYMTVEKMRDQGANSFMLIHDSYGVPPYDVEKLNVTIRDCFVELFQANPLRDWVSQVSPSHLGEADEIMINTLDLKEVRGSTYIFS